MAQSQYATLTELAQFSISAAAATRFGDTAMTANLQAASGMADSYIAAQFVLPLQTSPQGWDTGLTIAVCNIAAYLLYAQVGFGPQQAAADKVIEERYNRAIAWLEKISKHEITPQWADSSGTTTGSDRAGNFVVSDVPVGFTDRGLSSGATASTDPWDW